MAKSTGNIYKEKEVVVEKAVETVKVVSISPITQDFAREDLNLLRDKINEVITKING